MSVLITAEGDTIDLIAWRAWGDVTGAPYAAAPPPGAVEAIYRANPGLAKRTLALPAGLEIRIPEFTPRPARAPIRLWD